MHRSLLTLAVALAALALAAPGASAKGPLAQALLTDCETALDREDREAVFEGRMRALKGTAKLQLRFTLEQATDAGEDWTVVDADGFGAWKSADPGVRKYVLTKAIGNLVAPASYRVTVRFRWIDVLGRVTLRRKLVSGVCRQPDLRPDLRITRLDVAPGADARSARYTATVRNTGRSASGRFDVVLNVDGADRPATVLASLGQGDRAYVDFTAPPCSPGSALAVTADAGTAVDEALESNNVFGRLCPFAAA
jgi:hypothetical protein